MRVCEACVRGGCAAAGWEATTRGACRGPGTHANERERTARVDCDAPGLVELCVGADVVVEASNAAGEGGGCSGSDVDTAEATAAIVLRCIGREYTLSERSKSRQRGVWRRAADLKRRR